MIKCGYCGAEFQTQEELAGHMMKHLLEQAQSQQERATQTYLLLAASQLTQICLVSGKKPEEAVEVFSRVHELLRDWRGGQGSPDEFIRWLNSQWKQDESEG